MVTAAMKLKDACSLEEKLWPTYSEAETLLCQKGPSSQGEFQENIYFCFTDYAKAFDYVDHNKLWKI